MKKLNKRKIRWIVREVRKRNVGVYSIAKVQSITQQHARLVYRKYKGVKDPVLLPCGRKPKAITKQERQLIKQTWKEYLASRNFREVYRRLDRKKPSSTIVPGHQGFPIHPTENRLLTVREAARLQTFPDTYKFFGSKKSQGLQVGNAVPPLLARAFGLHIKKLLSKNK